MAYDLTLYYYLKDRITICDKTSSDDETMIRCPFCGDSKKDSRKTRFYIHNESPYHFICFNCDTVGVINEEVLSLITNGNIDGEVLEYIKGKQKEYKYKNNVVRKKILRHPYFNTDNIPSFNCKKSYLSKMDYLSTRLDYQFELKDIKKFKIVLSLYDFFHHNKIDIDKRILDDKVDYVMSELDKNYIGFLSADRNIIIFRNLDTSKDNHRFNNFKLFVNQEYISKKTYSISTKANKLTDKHHINIAEGPIDIIGTYLYLKETVGIDQCNKEIFLANGGKSYVNSAQYLTSTTLLNNDYTIYSDKDVNLDFYKKLKSTIPEYSTSKLEVCYNNLYKDFGVPINQIELSRKYSIKGGSD